MNERDKRGNREKGRSGRASSSHAIDVWFDDGSRPVDLTPNVASESRDETSHIARRRFSSADAHEVMLSDLIDMIDEEPLPMSPRPPSVAMRATPPSPRPAPFSSITGKATLPEPASPRPRSRRPRLVVPPAPSRGTLVATAIVAGLATLACVAVIALIVTVKSRAGRIEPRVISPPKSATVAPATAPTAATPPVASGVDVTTLPRPTTGTVLGKSARRLWIDGKLANDSTAIVPCGVHSVQVGSAGAVREVDVPCGSAIRVMP